MHEHATSNTARIAGLEEARAAMRRTGAKQINGRRTTATGEMVYSAAPSADSATMLRRSRLRVIEAELTLNRSRRLEQLHRDLGSRS